MSTQLHEDNWEQVLDSQFLQLASKEEKEELHDWLMAFTDPQIEEIETDSSLVSSFAEMLLRQRNSVQDFIPRIRICISNAM